MSQAAIATPALMSAAMAAAIPEGRKMTFREAAMPQLIDTFVSMVGRVRQRSTESARAQKKATLQAREAV